ncbi:MAG: aromatic ring-hydroxylating dioxygenase subunit alpha [Rhodospirillaceae bacterium]|nr:aromatic ring-hydroxylating dioxygenase subunit alpha [Rhodospirillaceae bacterium]MYB13130.1 aromatic ring-hydroxylating dioxygenase subunit alpha [Rhodospirillaceae bacterium]MYI48890.1 aromatic ring-hydroxylating dioxygenase subunit alpha [Rhodospirillaceae bacterium]
MPVHSTMSNRQRGESMSSRNIKPLIPNAWYIAAWSDELPEFEAGGKPLARTILNRPLVLFRGADGRAAALEDRCCHRGAPLSLGMIVDDGLQCGYHGMTFSGDGRCTVNPGEDPSDHWVQGFPVAEKQRAVWIWMGDPALADPADIVEFPWHDRTGEWCFRYSYMPIECSFMLVMDNLMDLTHLGYVHGRTIGGTPQFHVAAEQETKRTENGARMVRWTMNSPPPPTFSKAMPFKGMIDRMADFEYVAPASVIQFTTAMDVGRGARENPDQPGALRIRILHHATPETETTCHYFFSVGNGYRLNDPDANRDLFDEIYPTFLEDKAIMEGQQRVILRDPERPLLIREHDIAVAYANRALAAFARRAAAQDRQPAMAAAV